MKLTRAMIGSRLYDIPSDIVKILTHGTPAQFKSEHINGQMRVVDRDLLIGKFVLVGNQKFRVTVDSARMIHQCPM